MLRSQNPSEILAAMFMDFFAYLLALLLATLLRAYLDFGLEIKTAEILDWPIVFIGLLVWGLSLISSNLYETHRWKELVQQIFLSNSLAVSLFAGMMYFSFRDLSRLWVVYLYLFCLLLMILWRFLWWARRGKRWNARQRFIIVGYNPLGQQAATILQGQDDLSFLGFVDDKLPSLGKISEIQSLVQEHQVDIVFLALPVEAHHILSDTVILLQERSVQVWMLADYLNLTMSRLSARNLGGMLFVNLREPALSNYQRLIKRAFDIVLSVLLLPLLLPFLAFVAILIKLDSRGEIIFKQQRVGENGRLFIMYKFRTMFQNAESRLGEVLYQNEDGEIIYKLASDPRITRLGQFLRRSSIDELPQILNVLKGDMSLVGPRPEMPWLVDHYKLWQRKRFTVPPGITGWWQINGRSDKPMHLHTEEDLHYIQNYSLWLDLYILLKTLLVVFLRKGAY
jgi:exopolysaccharide biosynthesis polyprenyl glycosylphosphotransferase